MLKVVWCLIAASVTGVLATDVRASDIPWPGDTQIDASFRTEKDKGPKALIVGDVTTWMHGSVCNPPRRRI